MIHVENFSHVCSTRFVAKHAFLPEAAVKAELLRTQGSVEAGQSLYAAWIMRRSVQM